MSRRLDPNDLTVLVEMLAQRMEDENGARSFDALLRSWLTLLPSVAPGFSEQMPQLIDILQRPKAVSSHRIILSHIQQFDEVDTKIENNILDSRANVWKLVEWLETSEAGKTLNLNLDYRPH